MCLSLGGGSSSNAAAQEAARQRAEQEKREAQIRLGTNSVNDIFSQFNEDYFQRNLADPYVGFALPQFQEQRRSSFEDLIYALSGRGLLSSSIGARARNEFNNYADRQYQGILDGARSKVDEGLSQAEQSRNNIIANLSATGDAQGAIQAAQNQAALLGRAPSFSPLGALFANFTSSFLNNQPGRGTATPGSAGGGVSLFGGSGGSARTVG